MQADMTLVTNHINSYVRKALFGKCPYSLARNILPDDFFIFLGLEHIPSNQVILALELLK